MPQVWWARILEAEEIEERDMPDSIKITATQTYRPGSWRVSRDMLVVREDGSVGIVPAGTVLVVPVEEEQMRIRTEIK